MIVQELELPEVKLIVPTYFEDNRGYSTEAYNDRTLREYDIHTRFVVDYVCCNVSAGTIRGIHFQNNPRPQTKLVRVLQGEIVDFVIDLRRDSTTYKKWVTQTLSYENRKQLYLPSGFGHAYVTTRPNTVVLYKFDDYYDRDLVRAIRWNDPEIALPWGIERPVLSPADEKAPWLSESDVNLSVERNSL
jgi:dTDP-4-dehydrorhamnose 3,5-epimerase